MSKKQIVATFVVTVIAKVIVLAFANSCLVAGRPHAALVWAALSGILLGFLVGLTVSYWRKT